MRKILTIIFLFYTLFLYSQTSVIGRMQAEILTPVTAIETEILNFGKIVSGIGGGTIVISPNNEIVSTGNIILIDDNHTAGKFIVSGIPESLTSIQLPILPQKLYNKNSSVEIIVYNFTSNFPVGGQTTNQRDGKLEVNVGATLYIDGLCNKIGAYFGEYEIIFTYN